MHIQHIVYTKGLPASGKSTWAREYIDLHPKTVIINRDKIREMLASQYSNFPFGSSTERLVTDIELFSIDAAIERGYSVVVDATNLGFTEAKRLEYEKSLGIPVTIQDFTNVPLEVCIERDSYRSPSVGDDVIIRMYNKYLKPMEV